MGDAAEAPLPGEIAQKAKEQILDTIASMISGTDLPAAKIALRFARAYTGDPVATVVGSDILCGPIEAAMVNGMLAHADETDDSHAPSQSHPGCGIVAAALAASEKFGVSGMRMIRAVTLGFDVGTRIGMTLGGEDYQTKSSHDPHSITNNFGAAAAAACAAGLNAEQMRWILDYAGQQASGIAAWQRDTQHIEKSLVFGGFAARNGVTGALLINVGATGIADIFSGPDNFFAAFAPQAVPAGLVDKLGERYEIARTNIKKWTVGSPIQAPLDALQLIMTKDPFRADAVEKVVVRIGSGEARIVDNRDMPDISLQQMIAVMLTDGTVSFRSAHDNARMRDPEIRALRSRVQLAYDEGLQRLYPARVAIVEVTLKNGTHLTQRIDAVRGAAENPMSQKEVAAKARDLMSSYMGADRTEQLIEAVLDLEHVTDVRQLSLLLRRA
jgi:2-methylcitrate dehydratase PrpD